MALYSVFESAVESQDPLQRIEAAIWESLIVASASTRHPWNHGVFNTVELVQGVIEAVHSRTVILRSADPLTKTIDCHTDVRSQKVRDLENTPIASWTFYDSKSKIQLRVAGNASVIDDQSADEAWTATSLRSRASYLSIANPGDSFGSHEPPTTADRSVSQEESERGRVNFRVVRLKVHEIDWLYLRRNGHMRAKADYKSANSANLAWLIP